MARHCGGGLLLDVYRIGPKLLEQRRSEGAERCLTIVTLLHFRSFAPASEELWGRLPL